MNLSLSRLAIGILILTIVVTAVPKPSFSQSESTDGSRDTEKNKLLMITEVELSPSNGTQWIEIYNPNNNTVSGPVVIRTADKELPNFMISSTAFAPKEYRVVQLGDNQTQNLFPTTNTSLTLWLGNQEVDRTPPLTDNAKDSKTWQLGDAGWVFEEQTPTRAIPEFSDFALLLLSIPIMAAIFVTRTRGKKGVQ